MAAVVRLVCHQMAVAAGQVALVGCWQPGAEGAGKPCCSAAVVVGCPTLVVVPPALVVELPCKCPVHLYRVTTDHKLKHVTVSRPLPTELRYHLYQNVGLK